MYKGAHLRHWYRTVAPSTVHILRPHSAVYSEVLFPSAEQREALIRENEKYMDLYPHQIRTEVVGAKEIRYVSKEYEEWPKYLDAVPEAAHPHMIIRRVDEDADLFRGDGPINPGGTSLCTAIQLASFMGASEIHLYGAEFSNRESRRSGSSNYFYEAEEGEGGQTLPHHAAAADRIIRLVVGRGIPVYSHGPTVLSNTIQCD
ncbi:MAG: hypothetical protein AAGA68_26000 [Pseudomonadota bacterium]